MKTIYIGNDTSVSLNGLTNKTLGTYINNATGTITISDENGDTVSGVTFPLSLAYVANSDGDYVATIDSTLSLTEGKIYNGTVDVSVGSVDAQWKIQLMAQIRRADD